jgi:hypothetical protein
MAIMRPPMHFAAGDHIDPGDFLFEDRGLRCTKLASAKSPGGS